MTWGRKPQGRLLHAWTRYIGGYVKPLCDCRQWAVWHVDVPTYTEDGKRCATCERKAEKKYGRVP